MLSIGTGAPGRVMSLLMRLPPGPSSERLLKPPMLGSKLGSSTTTTPAVAGSMLNGAESPMLVPGGIVNRPGSTIGSHSVEKVRGSTRMVRPSVRGTVTSGSAGSSAGTTLKMSIRIRTLCPKVGRVTSTSSKSPEESTASTSPMV